MLKITFASIAREFGITRRAVAQKAKRMGHDKSQGSWMKLYSYYAEKYNL